LNYPPKLSRLNRLAMCAEVFRHLLGTYCAG